MNVWNPDHAPVVTFCRGGWAAQGADGRGWWPKWVRMRCVRGLLGIVLGAMLGEAGAGTLKVLYAASEAGVVSKRCLDSLRGNYPDFDYSVGEVPYSRLVRSTGAADVLLCIPAAQAPKGYIRLKKIAIRGRTGYFMGEASMDRSRCAALLGMFYPEGFRPLIKVSSGVQMINLLKINRINCVYIVEDDFVELLKTGFPEFKYGFIADVDWEIYGWAKPEAAKILDR